MRRMNSIFQLTNPSKVITFKFRAKTNKKKTNGGLCHLTFLTCLELLDDSEVETNDILGEDDDIPFISVASSYMRKNLK